MTRAVELRDVCFRYPEAAQFALDHVTLEVPEGTFVLVTGSTGSGKSTLLRAMNGLVPHFTGGAFSGRVVVEGRDTLENAPRDLADVVAFVPQEPAAAFVLDKVEDELAYAMENLGVEPQVMRRRVEETLDLLDIERLRARSVRSLSGGERQRVAIASALTPGPRILLLDEPTSQLDPQGAEDVLAALQRLVHDLGMTVILAEHRLERVAGFVDLAIACEAGATSLGSPAAVLSRVELGPPVVRLGRLVGWEPPPLTVRDARRRAGELTLGSPPPDRVLSHGPIAIATRGLRAGYDATPVLEGIDLSVGAGDLVALIGRNGAGKTTLLRCLAGVHEPSAGEVIINGHAPRPGRDVSLCPQSPDTLLFADTVEQEITASRPGDGLGPDEMLAALGIEAVRDEHPRDLSAGERLLVATAAVAVAGAPVLLLDEPTRGLDPHSKALLALFLREWSERGYAVVFATHDVELIAELATRVVMLAGGEIVADGAPEGVLSDSAVFSPQMTRVFGRGWLTPQQVARAATL